MFTFFCLLSIVSFFCYGASCVFSDHMVVEFKRYGLAPFRLLTGYLQLLGATGLLLGLLASPAIGLIASIGLSAQPWSDWALAWLARESRHRADCFDRT